MPRRHIALVMESLARTGLVEFEAADDAQTQDLSSLEPYLSEYARLRQEHGAALPEPDTSMRADDRSLETIAEDALGRLQAWTKEAGPQIRALEVALRHEAELAVYHRIFARLANADPGLVFPGEGDPETEVRIRIFTLPPGAEVELSRELTVCRVLDAGEGRFLLAAGTAHSIEALSRDMTAQNARRLELPEWARGPVDVVRDEAKRRLEASRTEGGRLRDALHASEERYRIPEALGDMIRIVWVAGEMEHFPVTEHLGWITGWTSARGEEPLRRPLDRLDLPYALHFAGAPPGKVPPSILLNPPWARPFELFARLLGTPGVQETDPSIFLAVIAPLLFGYMFGDVGQGAVLLIAGLLLRRRIPALGLLVPGGLAAIGFGILFGEFFALEHALPALWLRPLDEPLIILFAPLVAGGAIIALGLLLGGLTAIWRRTFGHWLVRDLGLVLAYAAIWGSLLDPAFLGLAGVGVIWYVAGHLTDRFRSPIQNLMEGVGALTENALRLLINTISFVRVGAFALAHGGLGLAVSSLAEAAGTTGQWLVLLLGNLLIIVIEGLVVSVQTTRLILFEFFIRFLQATGRPFRPSLPPEWAVAVPSTRGQAP